jgi:ferredoxin
MAHKINDNCFACGRCYKECRNGAIREGVGTKSVINPDRCTECVGWYETPRCFDCCYVNAPEPDPAYKESREELLAKFKKLHPHKAPVVT